MKNVVQSSLAVKIGAFALSAALYLVALGPSTARADSAPVSQLQYLQWLVQLSGDSALFSADSTEADYQQWARSKNMNPTGGWQTGATLTRNTLAQTLVQLYDLNPHKFGGDYIRILQRSGIDVPETITRQSLVTLIDETGFQSRMALVAAQSLSPKHGNNGVGNGQDAPPPGWLNPRNPHFGQPQNDGPGTGPGNPGNKHHGRP